MGVDAKAFVERIVDKVREPAIPYRLGGRSSAGTDCINLVAWCLGELGYEDQGRLRGSNTAWRKEMGWTSTLAEAKAAGKLIPGALLYICDGASEKWPDGDYGHVGVYIGQPGLEVVHASASRAGVYGSTLKNGWTHAAWLSCITQEEGSAMGMAQVITEGGALNLRETPVATGKRVGSIPCGAWVEILDQSQDAWWRVRYAGLTGYCAAEYLHKNEDVKAQILRQIDLLRSLAETL